ncbi:MAG: uracil-DNA glycosylase [Leptospiraceae bacterium]|nr:uracil-DNA glycosylase [Leptospiraceae bacterium]
MSQLDFFSGGERPTVRKPEGHAHVSSAGRAPVGASEFASEFASVDAETRRALLSELEQSISECTLCKLHSTRNTIVFGEGHPDADVMFIGEGPGRVEDQTGRPFVGPAGELLTRIIENGMGVPRTQVYIANVVKCRPTIDLKFERDRPPEADEVRACSPVLLRQIALIQPKVIVTLGNPATKFLLNTTRGITGLRGQWSAYDGIPVMPTYHPSYVLRQSRTDSGRAKKEVWSDIKQVLEKLGWPIPGK